MSDLPALTQKREMSQYITFKVGEELFGVNILCVDEIITPKPVTMIPRTPDYFLGILNLRGEVISIISLRARFELPLEKGEFNRIVVIQSGNMKLGLMVDEIHAITTLDEAEVQLSNRLVANERQQYLRGSYRLKEGGLLLLLDHDRLVAEEDFHLPEDLQPALAELHEAPNQVEPERKVPELFLIGFSIGEEHFSVESKNIEEIILMPEVTPVPQMSSFVEGIFQLRETVIPVVNLGQKLEVEGRDVWEESPVIIATIFGVRVGLIVDQITEVYIIKENEIHEPPINLNPGQQEQLKGVIKKKHGDKEDIIMLLILEKIFSLDEKELLQELDEQNEKALAEEVDLEEEVSILEFELKGERYAIPIIEASEIIVMREIVPVPKAPKTVEGVINLRGEVVTVVHLPRLVGNDEYEESLQTKILVVETDKEKAGLIVERVIGMRKERLSTFEPPSDLVRQRSNIFIRGMKKDEHSEDIIVLMDVQKTLYQAQNPQAGESEVIGLLGLQKELEDLALQEQTLLLGEK